MLSEFTQSIEILKVLSFHAPERKEPKKLQTSLYRCDSESRTVFAFPDRWYSNEMFSAEATDAR